MSKTKKVKISYCNGKKCKRKNQDVILHLKALAKSDEVDKNVKIKKIKCNKMCKHAPVVCVAKKLCFGVNEINELDNFLKIK